MTKKPPLIRTPDVSMSSTVRDDAVGVRIDDVRVERAAALTRNMDQLPGRVETSDQVSSRCVRQTVAVRREEHLIVAEVPPDGLEPLADRRPHPGVDERDAPAAAVAVQDLDLGLGAVPLEHEVVEQRLVVVEEVLA